MIDLKTTHGTFRGATPDTIVRRVYGRKATFVPRTDRNSPHAGMVTKKDEHGTHVLARVHWIN